MEDDFDKESILLRYLLGEMTDDEKQALEEQYFADDSLYEELCAVERELIDRYLEGDLTEKERGDFKKNFLSSPTRREKLKFAMTLKQSAQTKAKSARLPMAIPPRLPWWRRQFSISWAAAVATAALIVLGILLIRPMFSESDVTKGLEALASAYRDERPVESRMTGFEYAPFPQLRGNEQPRIDTKSRDRAEMILLNAVSEDPDAASHHAAGKLYLAKKDFDNAIKEFEAAIRLEPNNAQIHSDLGAALLEIGKEDRAKGDHEKSFEELAVSLEHLNRALELDNSLLNALFNRALLSQEMKLYDNARRDWQEYLSKDPNSPWANEARRNLNRLEERKSSVQSADEIFQSFFRECEANNQRGVWEIISRNRDINGSFIVNRLIDSHLDLASRDQHEEADRYLRALSYVGQQEAEYAGDHYTKDLYLYYRSAKPHQKEALIRGRALLKEGQEHLNKSRLEAGINKLIEAKEAFEQAGNPLEAAFTTYPLGHCYLLQRKPRVAIPVFEQLVRYGDANRYKWLAGQSLNAIANGQIGLTEYSLANETSRRSLKLLEEVNDVNGVIKTLVQIAMESLYLCNYRQALGVHQRILEMDSSYAADRQQSWRVYYAVAKPLSALGLFAAAVEYQKEALRLALELKMPDLIAQSYMNLGLAYGRQKNYIQAINNVEAGFETANISLELSARASTLAYASLCLGDFYRSSGEFDKALTNYDKAIELYDELDFHAFAYAAHKGKLLACIAQGDCPALEQEFDATLKLFDQHRSKILEESNRLTFFDAEQDVYDIAIDYSYSQKSNVAAFEYSERSRARSLQDMINAGIEIMDNSGNPDIRFLATTQALTTWEIQERLPPQSQIVQYSVLKDKVVLWVISNNIITSIKQDIPLKELTDKALSFYRLQSSLSESGSQQARAEAKQLYKLLISPVEQWLDSNKLIAIVPDKVLNFLPYAALISPETDRYFVEKYTLTTSPSSSLFIICSEIARAKEGPADECLLSIGNPAFDKDAFRGLPDLPSARREIEQISLYYNKPRSLSDGSATERRIASEIKQADIVHFAMHAEANDIFPIRSKFLLARSASESASDQDSDGMLHAYEIYKMDLSKVRVAILSACQTGVQRYYGGEGMIGISRPFIAKGVPLVVASLWPVDSRPTSELMIAFHKTRKREGRPTAVSLRRAQIEMLGGSDKTYQEPYYWSAFTTIGGYARF